MTDIFKTIFQQMNASFISCAVISVLFVSVFSFETITAQTQQNKRVEFWKMTKKYDANKNVTTISGNTGLFITRVREVCYDSDAEGLSMNNGHLTFSSNANGVVIYTGTGCFGSSCEYIFSDSDGYLNIKDGSNNVYVFVRSTIQNGKKAKLLSNTGTSSGGSYSTYSGSNGSSNNSISRTRPNNPGSKKKEMTCPYCKGQGSVKKSIVTSSYGVKDEYWTCPECGERSITRHGHIFCSHCHGTGKISY